MMPKRAIAKLQKGESVVEKFEMVTIFFSDIIGFTSMVGEMTPIQVMKMLNELYTIFDALVEKHGVYKVETIGDAYMVLGGAPDLCPASEGAEKVAKFALAALDAVSNFRREDGTTVLIRIGLASGPVVAGVIGRNMPRYDLFGDTVNFASRMESTSKSMRIQIAEPTYFLLKNAQGNSLFNMSMRLGDDGLPGIQVKGKGRVTTYWIHGMQGEAFQTCFSVASSAEMMARGGSWPASVEPPADVPSISGVTSADVPSISGVTSAGVRSVSGVSASEFPALREETVEVVVASSGFPPPSASPPDNTPPPSSASPPDSTPDVSNFPSTSAPPPASGFLPRSAPLPANTPPPACETVVTLRRRPSGPSVA